MTNETLRISMEVFGILTIGYLIGRTFRFILRTHAKVGILYLAYGLMCALLNDLYWMLFGLLRSDYRAPFGANEVGAIGMFLLFGSSLGFALRKKKDRAVLEATAAIVFSILSISFWIAWSGEWVKDIATGIPFAYLCFQAVRSVKHSGTLRRIEWVIIALIGTAVFVFQGLMFCAPDRLYTVLDVASYIGLYATLVYLLAKTFVKFFRDKTPDGASGAVALSSLCLVWALSSMYMSLDPMYFFPQFCSVLSLIMLTVSYIALTSYETGTDAPARKEAEV